MLFFYLLRFAESFFFNCFSALQILFLRFRICLLRAFGLFVDVHLRVCSPSGLYSLVILRFPFPAQSSVTVLHVHVERLVVIEIDLRFHVEISKIQI